MAFFLNTPPHHNHHSALPKYTHTQFSMKLLSQALILKMTNRTKSSVSYAYYNEGTLQVQIPSVFRPCTNYRK